MKKTICVLVTIAISIMLCGSAFATGGNNYLDDNNYSAVKEMLASLGMRQYYIDRLSEAELERYANAKGIKAYLQTINLADNDQDNAASPAVAPILPIFPDPETPEVSYTATTSNEYMFLYLLVVELDSGEYLFSTYATWNRMPNDFSTDSLGVTAEGMSYTPYSASGWFDFRRTENNRSVLYSTNFTNDQFTAPFYTGYGGAAVSFNMYETILAHTSLEDIASFGFVQNITEITVHMEFEVSAFNLDDSIAFRVKSTYDHSTRSYGYSPSISIDTSGSIGIGVSASAQNGVERLEVELAEKIIYDPDGE